MTHEQCLFIHQAPHTAGQLETVGEPDLHQRLHIYFTSAFGIEQSEEPCAFRKLVQQASLLPRVDTALPCRRCGRSVRILSGD